MWPRKLLSTLSFITMSFAVIGSLMLSACAKSGGDSNNGGQPTGTIVDTPCSGSSCYNQYGNGYFSPPPVPNPYIYGANNGYCGCSAGQRPVYNPTWGFACVSSQQLTYNFYLGYSAQYLYEIPSQNTIPLNMSQINYSPLPYGGTANCFQHIAAACDVRVSNPCTNGGQCRPVGGGSSIGVCTNGQGIENYYPQNPYPHPYGGYGGYPPTAPYGYNNCTYKQTSWGGYVYTCGFEKSGASNSSIPR